MIQYDNITYQINQDNMSKYLSSNKIPGIQNLLFFIQFMDKIEYKQYSINTDNVKDIVDSSYKYL